MFDLPRINYYYCIPGIFLGLKLVWSKIREKLDPSWIPTLHFKTPADANPAVHDQKSLQSELAV